MEGDRLRVTTIYTLSHFNPLPPHGGRPFPTINSDRPSAISIHSLRMEGDPAYESTEISARDISIHSLRMEGDLQNHDVTFRSRYFNPLPPHGGRHSHHVKHPVTDSISIHSLRMEGDIYHKTFGCDIDISIHSLRMEGDSIITGRASTIPIFQSTPSAWRETQSLYISYTGLCISIHSLRMEGDHLPVRNRRRNTRFQSTPSAWRETSAFQNRTQ